MQIITLFILKNIYLLLHMQWGVWGPTFILDWLQFLLILSKQVLFLLVATHI